MIIFFDIQRFSVHDGPGIRTTFFAKGCPLRCQWCHNPEGLSRQVQLHYLDEKCILCKACERVCSQKVHIFLEDVHRIDFDRCTLCGQCTKICPSKALTLCGFTLSPKEIVREARKDLAFYGEDGGITFSGGEVMLQAEALREAMILLKEEGIPVCIDTSGSASWKAFQQVLPFTQIFLYDIKCMDPDLHKKTTGTDNYRILENVKRLDEQGARLWIRIPVVNGFNNTLKEMEAIARFLRTLKHVERVTLLPYHKLGSSKYGQIGLEDTKIQGIVEASDIQEYIRLFLKYGLPIDV